MIIRSASLRDTHLQVIYLVFFLLVIAGLYQLKYFSFTFELDLAPSNNKSSTYRSINKLFHQQVKQTQLFHQYIVSFCLFLIPLVIISVTCQDQYYNPIVSHQLQPQL